MNIKGIVKLAQSGVKAVAGSTAKAKTTVVNAGSKVTATQAKVAAGAAAAVGVGLIANNVKDDISNGISEIGNTLKNLAAGGMGAIIGAGIPAIAQGGGGGGGKSGRSSSLTYPTTLSNSALNPAHINFQFYSRDTKNKLTSINLPMPDAVSNPSSINWDQESFHMMGDTMARSLKAIDKGTGTAEDIQTKMNSMAERIKSVAFYTGMSNVVGAVSPGGGVSAEGLMGAVSGKMPNPYRTMLFRGVDFRSFVFKFELVPFSESDCDLIHNIIMKFREHSYPDFAAEKMFFTYPDECQISYIWEAQPNKWLPNFKRAVCKSIEVDFTPKSQWTSLRNGFPNMITITTTWSEIEIITKTDITNLNGGQRS